MLVDAHRRPIRCSASFAAGSIDVLTRGALPLRIPPPEHPRFVYASLASLAISLHRPRLSHRQDSCQIDPHCQFTSAPAVPRIRHTMPSFRLDSSLPDLPWLTAPCTPTLLLRCESPAGPVRLTDAAGSLLWQANHPLDGIQFLDQHLQQHQVTPGRWIGYLSYDLGRCFEKLPSTALDDLRLPLYALGFCPDESAGQSHLSRPGIAGSPEPLDRDPSLSIASRSAPDPSSLANSPRPQSPVPPAPLPPSTPITGNFTPDAYRAAVARAIEYIRAGDIFQVNLAQRFSVPIDPAHAPSIYARLMARTPADYGALLDFEDFQILSNSPELFLAIDPDPAGHRIIRTRPIKGTRPRTPGMDILLRDSIKDAAELNMIIDLQRNDLGRICTIGTVKVTQPRTIEAHPTIYHGVATIQGHLRPGISILEILAATFPGGSITGAPKIRSMQIIEQLEALRRGPYCGAIGLFHTSGQIRLNIAIRTLILTGGQAHLSVGGGIVADSTPADEYAETLTKAQALFAALGLALPPSTSTPL